MSIKENANGRRAALVALEKIEHDDIAKIARRAKRDPELSLRIVFPYLDNPFVATVFGETETVKTRRALNDVGVGTKSLSQVTGAIGAITRSVKR